MSTTALSKSTPTALTALAPEFERARLYMLSAKASMVQGAAFMVLTGIELTRLKKIYGVKRGGDRKSALADQTRSESGLIGTWEQIVKAQLGVGDDTASKYIAMAESAKKRVEVLQELEEQLLATPMHLLPEDTQEKIAAAVKNLCDGKTGKEMMQFLGIAKKDPAPIKEEHRHQGGNSTATKLTEEEQSQNHFRDVMLMLMGLRLDSPERFAYLSYYLPIDSTGDATLHEQMTVAALLEELKAWTDHFTTVHERLARALHNSRKGGASAVKKALKEAGVQAPAEESSQIIDINSEEEEEA